jgi:two-component system KDP operon response regulator KdpE
MRFHSSDSLKPSATDAVPCNKNAECLPSSRPVAIVVEDEPTIRKIVSTALETQGWMACEAGTLRQGLAEARTRSPDLIILDLGLPDGDGMDFLKELRIWSRVPVIILSARVHEQDKIRALDGGADDYLAKPFSAGELLARVRAASRRQLAPRNDSDSLIEFSDVSIDTSTRTVLKAGAAIHVTPIEYRILALLIANEGRVLTHRQLLGAVWGAPHSQDSHYLRIYMSRLRQKLESDPARPQHILTETGVGYRLVQKPRQ